MSDRRYAVFYSRLNQRSYIVDLDKLRLDKMRRRIFAWCKAVDNLDLVGVKSAMITLTYDTEGTLVKPSFWMKEDISNFRRNLLARKSLEVLAYAWVCEVQERGVPHYHMIVLYRGRLPIITKSGLWTKGRSNTIYKLKTFYYIAKYLGKEKQKEFSKLPKGARAYAVSIRDVGIADIMAFESLSPAEKDIVTREGWDGLELLSKPEWARAVYVSSHHTKQFADYIAKGLDMGDDA